MLEGFAVPPLLFTPEEARALFLAGKLFVANSAGRLPSDAESALAKVRVVLPKPMRDELAQLAGVLHFSRPPQRFDLNEPHLAAINRAIREQRVTWIHYHALNTNEVTEREIEPLSLAWYQGAWYASAYCRLRQAPREFRLNRIDEMRVLDARFTPRSVRRPPMERMTAYIRFRRSVVRWVHERQHYGFVGEEDAGDSVVMAYEVDALDELRAWVLMWGADAEPLDPPELRAIIRDEVSRMHQILT